MLIASVVGDLLGVPTHAAVLSAQVDDLTLFLGAEPACAFVRERAARGESGPQILASLLGGASA